MSYRRWWNVDRCVDVPLEKSAKGQRDGQKSHVGASDRGVHVRSASIVFVSGSTSQDLEQEVLINDRASIFVHTFSNRDIVRVLLRTYRNRRAFSRCGFDYYSKYDAYTQLFPRVIHTDPASYIFLKCKYICYCFHVSFVYIVHQYQEFACFSGSHRGHWDADI